MYMIYIYIYAHMYIYIYIDIAFVVFCSSRLVVAGLSRLLFGSGASYIIKWCSVCVSVWLKTGSTHVVPCLRPFTVYIYWHVLLLYLLSLVFVCALLPQSGGVASNGWLLHLTRMWVQSPSHHRQICPVAVAFDDACAKRKPNLYLPSAPHMFH